MNPAILIVDDEEPIRFALQSYFDDQGYRVDCAVELEEAQALLATTRYDVIITDLRLDGMDDHLGIGLLETATTESVGTHVIILTAYGSPTLKRTALRLGAHAFLEKPRPLHELGALVRGLLAVAQ